LSFARAYVNGCYSDLAQAVIPVSDRGFLYGDSLFETLRTYRGRPFLLPEHLQRLLGSCQALGFPARPSQSELESIVETLCAESDSDLYLRLSITRGSGFGPLPSAENPQPGIVVVARQLTGYPDDLYQRGMRIQTAKVRRSSTDMLSRHKTGNFLPSIMARKEAAAAGYDEALLLNDSGRVAELSAANLFVISGNDLLTPELSEGPLPGITRKLVMDLAADIGMNPRECRLEMEDLLQADQLFASNSILEICPISEIDRQHPGQSSGDSADSKLAQLQSAYRAEVLRRCP
jgi:branched-chain amino acid aminotransferase